MFFKPAPKFGKRRTKSEIGRRIEVLDFTDDDGVARLISKELWEDPKLSKFFQMTGMDPDDPANLVPTQQVVNARMDAAIANQKRFERNFNLEYPAEHAVGIYAMVPWELWHQEYELAGFLIITCKLYPAQPWNSMLLPLEESGGTAWQLPVHPKNYPDEYIFSMIEFIENIKSIYEK